MSTSDLHRKLSSRHDATVSDVRKILLPAVLCMALAGVSADQLCG
jgi:hypothetical protein